MIKIYEFLNCMYLHLNLSLDFSRFLFSSNSLSLYYYYIRIYIFIISSFKIFFSRKLQVSRFARRLSPFRAPYFLRDRHKRPNVNVLAILSAFRTSGDTFIGAIRSTEPRLITRSVTFYSPIETRASHTIGKPMSPKIRDILPAVIESILARQKRERARACLFDTFVPSKMPM